MIEVAGLEKLYGELVAVEDLSFTVAPGRVLGLLGPNGAGKTTTLRCLGGILRPSRGAIRLCGNDLASAPVAAKRTLAFFSDEPRLFDALTVAQHLNFVARLYQVTDWEARAGELLEELELGGKRQAFPGELSRGMKQKLAIACGLLHGPRVILFDEPLTGLDPIGIRRMKDTITARARQGAAVVVSSHLLPLVREICTDLLILKAGRCAAMGTMQEVTARFTGGSEGDAGLEEAFLKVTAEAEA